MSHTQNTEFGNVLWLVLAGVALLATLSITLSRSSSRVESSGDDERLRIEALQIMRYAQGIENAVQNLKFQGISENDISFENLVTNTDYSNPSCTDNTCRIFHIEGAGLNYLEPRELWLDTNQVALPFYSEWLFTGNACIPLVGNGNDVNCASDDRNLELVAILPYIKQTVCIELNILANMELSGPNPPADIGSAWDGTPQFLGDFENGQNIADTNEDLFGEQTGCFEGGGTPGSGTYHFYHVISAR